MDKRTAIIDIGSNSARLVIFEETSRYGFHLICEQKSKVRIGEGAYEKNGQLQPIGIKRAFFTLQSFLHTIKKYQVQKTICVATSALRDAPNAKIFTKWIKIKLGLCINIIDGNKEAQYGAIAAKNLLPIQDAISIDIGGGSSDIALIQNGNILETYSLNLGTVRLKELFFDKNITLEEKNKQANEYIKKQLNKLPDSFKSDIAIGIGGTARSLSEGIMKQCEHPLDKLHAFTYNINDFSQYLKEIPLTSAKNLKKFKLKESRFDTIREGVLIWNAILSHIASTTVITSSAGVREGIFLEYLLRRVKLKFPHNINPSMTSLLDRFKPQIKTELKRKNKIKIAEDLYEELQDEVQDNKVYSPELQTALNLSSIGKTLTIYKAHKHAFYIAKHELNYAYTHEQMILVSLLLRMHGSKLLKKSLYKQYKTLLPNKNILSWLSFIYTLSIYLYEASNSAKIDFMYKNKTLLVKSDKPLYLAKEKIKKLEKPSSFAIIIKDKDDLPSNKELGIK